MKIQAHLTLTFRKNNTTIFNGKLNVSDGTVSFDAAEQKISFTKGTKISVITGENNQFVMNMEIADKDAGFKIEADANGNFTFTPDENDGTINFLLKNGDEVILQKNIARDGAFVLNPETQKLTLKKDTVVTLKQGTNILQITALEDAGGTFTLTTESISFKPDSNDGALELNFIDKNRKVTANPSIKILQ